MKILGLNTHMEGWWEKDRLRKTSLRLNCIKTILPGAMSSRTDKQIGLLHQRWTLGGQKSTKNSQTLK